MFRPILLAIGLTTALGAVRAAEALPTPRVDANGDGRISEAEFLAAAAARFDALDRHHRGSLDAGDFAAAPAWQARAERRVARLLERADRNDDGVLDAAEARAARERLFARLDRNGDGVLEHGEWARPAAPDTASARDVRREQRLQALDTDHDGGVSRAEFLAAADARFAAADSNHDGRLGPQELLDAPDRAARRDRLAARLVARLDSDHDGRVSREEYLAAARERFARRDRNGDGVLDRGEGRPQPH